MEQQDQADRIQQYLSHNPIGEAKSLALTRRMHKAACKFFEPFREYFQAYPVQYIVEPKPAYLPRCQHESKINTAVSKQMEYLRGVTKDYIGEQFLKQVLEDDYADRGLVQRLGNRTAIVGDMLIYGFEQNLRSIALKPQTKTPPIHTNKVDYQFPEDIHELVLWGQSTVLVRGRYWLHLLDIARNQPICEVRFAEEITAVCKFGIGRKWLVATYAQRGYKLYEWDLETKSSTCIKSVDSFWPVHSLVCLNSREFVVGLGNKAIIEDLRSSRVTTLKRVQQVGNDRFVSLCGVGSSRLHYVLSRNKSIDLFDIRNSSESIVKSRHFCEQAPPSVLLTQVLESENVLVAYSPAKLGSSLLFNLTLNSTKSDAQLMDLASRKDCTARLLYDSGKMYPGMHPHSIALSKDQDTLRLFHVDSLEGISVETLKKVSERNYFVTVRPSQRAVYPENPCKKWVEEKTLQPYIRQSEGPASGQISSDSDQQQALFQRKNHFCTLDKFRSKIIEISRNKNDSKQKEASFLPFMQTLPNSYQSKQGQQVAQILRMANRQEHSSIDPQLFDMLQKQWTI